MPRGQPKPVKSGLGALFGADSGGMRSNEPGKPIKSNLGALFGSEENQAESNDMLTYRQDRSPFAVSRRSHRTSDASSKSNSAITVTSPKPNQTQFVFTGSAQALFRLDTDKQQFVSMASGAVGYVITGTVGAFQFLVYNQQKQYLLVAPCTASGPVMYLQDGNYCSIRDSKGNLYSLLCPSAAIQRALLLSNVVARALSDTDAQQLSDIYAILPSTITGNVAVDATLHTIQLTFKLYSIHEDSVAQYVKQLDSKEFISTSYSQPMELHPNNTSMVDRINKRFIGQVEGCSIAFVLSTSEVDQLCTLTDASNSAEKTWTCALCIATLTGVQTKQSDTKQSTPATEESQVIAASDVTVESTQPNNTEVNGKEQLVARMARLAKSAGGGVIPTLSRPESASTAQESVAITDGTTTQEEQTGSNHLHENTTHSGASNGMKPVSPSDQMAESQVQSHSNNLPSDTSMNHMQHTHQTQINVQSSSIQQQHQTMASHQTSVSNPDTLTQSNSNMPHSHYNTTFIDSKPLKNQQETNMGQPSSTNTGQPSSTNMGQPFSTNMGQQYNSQPSSILSSQIGLGLLERVLLDTGRITSNIAQIQDALQAMNVQTIHAASNSQYKSPERTSTVRTTTQDDTSEIASIIPSDEVSWKRAHLLTEQLSKQLGDLQTLTEKSSAKQTEDNDTFLQEEIENLQEQLSRSQQERGKWQQRFFNTKSQIRDLQNSIDMLEMQNTTKEDEIENLRTQLTKRSNQETRTSPSKSSNHFTVNQESADDRKSSQEHVQKLEESKKLLQTELTQKSCELKEALYEIEQLKTAAQAQNDTINTSNTKETNSLQIIDVNSIDELYSMENDQAVSVHSVRTLLVELQKKHANVTAELTTKVTTSETEIQKLNEQIKQSEANLVDTVKQIKTQFRADAMAAIKQAREEAYMAGKAEAQKSEQVIKPSEEKETNEASGENEAKETNEKETNEVKETNEKESSN